MCMAEMQEHCHVITLSHLLRENISSSGPCCYAVKIKKLNYLQFFLFYTICTPTYLFLLFDSIHYTISNVDAAPPIHIAP